MVPKVIPRMLPKVVSKMLLKGVPKYQNQKWYQSRNKVPK